MPISPPSDLVILNQLAWRLAAGIAAAAALVAVIVTTSVDSPGAIAAPVPRTGPGPVAASEQALPAAPAMPVGGDLERCIEFCARHVTTERSFVVFSHGTCVIVDEPSSQPIVDAIHLLEDCSGPNARFITREIEDGHCLVTYRRAAFNCLFSEEIEAQRQTVEASFLNHMTSTERASMSAGFDPPFHAKLGLVARSRMNEDARDLSVAKVIRAKPVAESPEPDADQPIKVSTGPPPPSSAPTSQTEVPAPRITPPLLPGW